MVRKSRSIRIGIGRGRQQKRKGLPGSMQFGVQARAWSILSDSFSIRNFDSAIAQMNFAVGISRRFLAVGYHDDSAPVLLIDLAQKIEDRQTIFRIEVTRGLVG